MLKPSTFDLNLPTFVLEGGAALTSHRVRGWVWSTHDDDDAIASLVAGESTALTRDIPTVLVVHALTGDACVGGPGGWWEPLIGPGRAIDTDRFRVLCFNNLGSCYGTTGPDDHDFPRRRDESRGEIDPDAASHELPATVTTWDQAASIVAALEVLGIRRIELVTGGSIGGMITLCLRELLGERVSVCMPIAACAAASPWIIGWNHVGRQLLLAAGLDGEVGRRALSLARQLALISYRAEPGLEQRQGRRMVGTDTWDAGASYAMQTYLEHQGRKLLARFSARAYFVQLGAMDHHDVSRLPYGRAETGCSHLIAVGINSDQLFYKVHSESLVDDALRLGQSAEYRELNSLHGHDGFLIEWEQMDTLTRYALSKIQTA